MRFIIIKKNFNDSEMLINVLKNLLGKNIRYDEDDKFIIIYHEYISDEDIIKVLNSLSEDLMINLVSYISSFDDNKLKEELSIAKNILANNKIPSGVYHFKSLLLKKPEINNKRQILDLILDSTGVGEDFIIDFAKNDLNVSKASKAMYIHRNTMIYKLDKLKELSDFDLRCFLDAYILFNLLDN